MKKRFRVGFKNGLHLNNKSGLQGLYIINSLVTLCDGESYSIG